MPRREIRQYPSRQACRYGAFRDDPNTTHRCWHIRMYINGIYRIAGSVVMQSMGHHTRCSASCTIGHLDRSASGGQDSTSQTERARSETGAVGGGAPAPGTGLCERQRVVIPGAVPRLCRAPERSGGVAPPYALSPFYPYNDKHIGVLTQKGAATCVFRVFMRSSTLTRNGPLMREAHMVPTQNLQVATLCAPHAASATVCRS